MNPPSRFQTCPGLAHGGGHSFLAPLHLGQHADGVLWAVKDTRKPSVQGVPERLLPSSWPKYLTGVWGCETPNAPRCTHALRP